MKNASADVRAMICRVHFLDLSGRCRKSYIRVRWIVVDVVRACFSNLPPSGISRELKQMRALQSFSAAYRYKEMWPSEALHDGNGILVVLLLGSRRTGVCCWENHAVTHRQTAFIAEPLHPFRNAVVVLSLDGFLVLAKPKSRCTTRERELCLPLHLIALQVHILTDGVLLKELATKVERVKYTRSNG